jgi:hypothetical protein
MEACMTTYLTTKQLAERLGFSAGYIANLKDRFFVEGVHYIRPFGGSIRYVWEEVEAEINRKTKPTSNLIPMSRGGYCYG